jgi:tetratricopeptide (TPR) repeat protein
VAIGTGRCLDGPISLDRERRTVTLIVGVENHAGSCAERQNKIGPTNPHRKDREPAARLQHALKLHQAGHLQEAIKVYRQILAVDPGSVQARTFCGAALLDQQRPDEAAQNLQIAISIDPKNVDALCYLGKSRSLTEFWIAEGPE